MSGSIFEEIEKKKQQDAEKAIRERAEKINAIRDKIIDLLKAENLNVQDSSIVLKVTQDKINMSLFDKLLSQYV